MRDIVPRLVELIRADPRDREAAFLLAVFARSPLLSPSERPRLRELMERRGSRRDAVLANAASYVLSRVSSDGVQPRLRSSLASLRRPQR